MTKYFLFIAAALAANSASAASVSYLRTGVMYEATLPGYATTSADNLVKALNHLQSVLADVTKSNADFRACESTLPHFTVSKTDANALVLSAQVVCWVPAADQLATEKFLFPLKDILQTTTSQAFGYPLKVMVVLP